MELPGVGLLFSEGRADAHLQLEQQLLERLALKSPLVSKQHHCSHPQTSQPPKHILFLHLHHLVIIHLYSAYRIAKAPESGPQ